MLLSKVMSYTKLTSLCECGPRDPTKKLITMAPKDQTSVLRETHSGRTSLQDMGKDVCRVGGAIQQACDIQFHTSMST